MRSRGFFVSGRGWTGLLVAVMAVAMPPPRIAAAAERTWSNTAAGDSSWTSPANWRGGGVPTDGDAATLGSDFASLSVNLNASGTVASLLVSTGSAFTFSSTNASRLTLAGGSLSRTAASAGTQTISADIMLGTNAVWAVDGAGILAVSGRIGADDGAAGLTKTGTGTLILSGSNSYPGGTTVSSGTLAVGAGGVIGRGAADITVGSSPGDAGTLAVAGGGVSARSASLGRSAGSVGTVTAASGTVSLKGIAVVGGSGTGVLAVSGGRLTSGYGWLGASAGSVGTVTVSSGTWDMSESLNVGLNGAGTLHVAGGSVSNGSSYLGSGAGSSFLVTVSGGTWAQGGDLIVGDRGSGSLVMSGGLVTVGGLLYKGPQGTLVLNAGGTLQMGIAGSAGELAADLVADGRLVFFSTADSACAASISGTGTITKAGIGTLALSASNSFSGVTTVQLGTLQLAAPAALGSSGLVPLSGGTVSLTPYLRTVVGGLQPDAGGLVDVGSGMITAPSGLSPLEMLDGLLAGRGDGSWTGTTGITSSVAAADLAQGLPRTVGWIDAAGGLAFAYAAPGDTNLDWIIDILDAADFLAGGKFDTGGAASWTEGDFGYDGVVDILDAADFFSTGLFDAGIYNAPPESAAVAAVPEPMAWPALLVAAGAVLAGRRQRRGWGG